MRYTIAKKDKAVFYSKIVQTVIYLAFMGAIGYFMTRQDVRTYLAIFVICLVAMGVLVLFTIKDMIMYGFEKDPLIEIDEENVYINKGKGLVVPVKDIELAYPKNNAKRRLFDCAGITIELYDKTKIHVYYVGDVQNTAKRIDEMATAKRLNKYIDIEKN